jgi:hypothetical protein
MIGTESKAMRWHAHLILIQPARVARGLERAAASGLVEEPPNLWQVSLGVLRMWHRLLFRSETVGTSRQAPVRGTWRARLLAPRPLRFPFLLAERAVAPLDFSGLASDEGRITRHLLGAHHDGRQFAYDLELLRCHPGALERVEEAARAIVEGRDPRASWLRDLVVFEGYHEALLAAVTAARRGELGLSSAEARDPDISFRAYLQWCAAQPATPAATWLALRAGEFSLATGLATASRAAHAGGTPC